MTGDSLRYYEYLPKGIYGFIEIGTYIHSIALSVFYPNVIVMIRKT